MSRAALNSNAQTSGTELFDCGDFFDSAGNIQAVAGYTGRKINRSTGVTNIAYAKDSTGGVSVSGTYTFTNRYVGIDIEKDTAWNFTGIPEMVLEIGFDPLTNGCDQSYTGFKVCLMYDSGTTETNFLWNTNNVLGPSAAPKQGRMTIRFQLSDFSVAAGAKSVAEVIAATKRIQIRCYAEGFADPTSALINASFRVRRLYSMPRQRAKLAFSFDDFHPSVVTFVKPIFDSYGWVGAVGACGGPISNPTAYGLTSEVDMASPAQVTTLHNAGWSVANHTLEHRGLVDRLSLSSYTATGHALGDRIAVLSSRYANDRAVGEPITIAYGADPKWCNTYTILAVTDDGLAWGNDGSGTIAIQLPAAPNLTSGMGYMWAEPPDGFEAHLVAQLDSNKAYCLSQGWTRGSDIVIYPYGAISPAIKPLLAARGYRAARSVRYQFDCVVGGSLDGITNYEIGGLPTFGGWFDPYDLPIIYIDDASADFDTAAELLAMVDRVIADGGVCLPYGHAFTGSGASNYETAEATAFFAGVRQRELQGLIDVVGLSELVDIITDESSGRISTNRLVA